MNTKERIELVRAMDTVARHFNDEELYMIWLSLGVADGDYKLADEDLTCYCEDDEDFSALMALFTRLMARAKESGLFCDKVVSDTK